MSHLIFRSYSEPIRQELSWNERWKADDIGLIACWELGRTQRIKEPELAARADNKELPILGWKGGVEKAIKKVEKYGTLYYLAQWQGLRGEDLNINLSQDTSLICSKTGLRVTFTADVNKYSNANS